MFISPAFAQEATEAAAQEPSILTSMLPLIIIFALFYLLVIRPQSKRMKTHAALLQALQIGDKVVTAGGIYGKVVSISEKEMVVEIAPGVNVTAQKHTISALQEQALPVVEPKK